jgi:ferrochelatase
VGATVTRYTPEPASARGRDPRTAVLLVNLGTPDEPTAPAVRRYLREFLSDPRVVEIPKPLWSPILNFAILPSRPAKSAAKYATVWTPEGSPLATWTAKVGKMLAGYLGERGQPVLVRHAMRYGSPSIAGELDAMKEAGVTRVLVLPLYPQYAGATTGSTMDAVSDWTRRVRRVPALRFVDQYHADSGYVEALADSVLAHWQVEGRADKLVLSFHGLPARSRALGDPYYDQCRATAHRLAERLALPDDAMVFAFQSRFGRARWLEPYTEPTLKDLARKGVRRVDVMCPGFATDCLETLEEIAMEARAAFIAAGGSEFRYIPCLNDRPRWIAALADIALRNLQGWPAIGPS